MHYSQDSQAQAGAGGVWRCAKDRRMKKGGLSRLLRLGRRDGCDYDVCPTCMAKYQVRCTQFHGNDLVSLLKL